MASVKNTKSDAECTPKSSATRLIALEALKNVNGAITQRLRTAITGEKTEIVEKVESVEKRVIFNDVEGVQDATWLAQGAYNSVWLARLRDGFQVSGRPSTLN